MSLGLGSAVLRITAPVLREQLGRYTTKLVRGLVFLLAVPLLLLIYLIAFVPPGLTERLFAWSDPDEEDPDSWWCEPEMPDHSPSKPY
jgi:hypothetical protein